MFLHFFINLWYLEDRPILKTFWGSKEKKSFILLEILFVCLFFVELVPDRGQRGMEKMARQEAFIKFRLFGYASL